MNFNPSELLAILPSLSMSEREEVLRLLEELEDRQAVEDARADFLSFVRMMYPEYMTGPHHKYLADLLQDVERGVKDRIAVSVGPRFGKSLLISTYYPAWYLGHHPDHYVILASHTADLAVDFSRKVRNIINSPEYRRIFPETVVSSDSKAAGKWSTTKGGEFFAVGVGGAIAGRGAHLLLCVRNDALVPTRKGYRRAEDVKVGDEVLTHVGFKVVSRVQRTTHEREVCVDGAVMSDNHPVWTFDRGWVNAGLLTTRDLLYTPTLLQLLEVWYGGFKDKARALLREGLQHLGDDAPEVQQPESRELCGLRRAGDIVLSAVGKLFGVLRRYGGPTLAGTHAGPGGPAWKLHPGELPVGDRGRTAEQPEEFEEGHRVRANPVAGAVGAQDRPFGGSGTPSHSGDGNDPGGGVRRTPDELGAAPRTAQDCGRLRNTVVRLYSHCRQSNRSSARVLVGVLEAALRRPVCGLLLGVRHPRRVTTRPTPDGAFFIDFTVPGANTFFVGSWMTHNCDDPFSEQDILSGKTEAFEKAYQWFTFGARTRLMASGAVAILHTRWSPADLIGRLITDMAANPQADQYEVVEFPAILPSGKALWPEMWPLEKLERTRASMPAFQWSAQYQQQPTSEEGAIIAREKWQRWEREKPPKTDWLLMSIDTAYTVQTRSDYSACTLWGVFHNEDGEPGIILINAWRAKMEFPELKRRVMIDNEKWRPDGIIIEAKAAGYPLIQEMRRSGIPVQAYTPSRGNDKMARLNAVSDLFESSMVWAPRGKWADEVIEEVAQFPAGAHDDYVDTCVLHSSKISMADGTTKMMSEIRVGDWVATPGGASRVTAVLEQGNKPLWELRVGDRVLHATGDHRVMTTRGWIRLDKLIPGEDCVVCYPPPELVGCRSKIREFARKWFGSMAGITDGIRTARTFTFAGISPGRAASCTGIYGSSTMVPSRKDTISTTRTRTRATIASRIWSAIRAAAISPSTSGPTPNGTGGRGGNSTSPPSGSRLPNGTRPKKAGRGTGNTRKILSLLRGKLSGSTDSRKNPLLVSGVEPKEQLQTAGKSSVVQSAGRRSPDTEGVSTVTFTHTTDRVMDLTVEGEHCFFAEGILVHNCSMALMRIRKGGLVRLPDDEDDDPLAGYMARRRYYY